MKSRADSLANRKTRKQRSKNKKTFSGDRKQKQLTEQNSKP
jgi:hypothetical protein